MRLPLLIMMLLTSVSAHAHKPSDSYLSLVVSEAGIEGQWDIALRDLDQAVGLDGDDDGLVTWGEVRNRATALAAYALERLEIRNEDAACPIETRSPLQVDHHTDGMYAVVWFRSRCPSTPRLLTVGYHLFFEFDPQHKGLLRLVQSDVTRTAIFSREAPTQTIELDRHSTPSEFLSYVTEGIWHIWLGYDHILFLLSLLLPSVLRRSGGRWEPVATLRPALVDVIQIVTAFTVAHSITLSMAVLGLLTLPSRWVESGIALSVVLASVNNLYPLFPRSRWGVAFGFGLVHGLGFASVLTDLGLPAGSLVPALLGFNLGVEAGQLAIVSAFLPLAFQIRGSSFYRRFAFGAGSVLIALIAVVWLVERSLDLKLFYNS